MPLSDVSSVAPTTTNFEAVTLNSSGKELWPTDLLSLPHWSSDLSSGDWDQGPDVKSLFYLVPPTHTKALSLKQALSKGPCPSVSKLPLTFDHDALNGNRSLPVLFRNAPLKCVPAQVGQNHAQHIRWLIISQACSLEHHTRISIQLPNHLALILFALILKLLSRNRVLKFTSRALFAKLKSFFWIVDQFIEEGNHVSASVFPVQ